MFLFSLSSFIDLVNSVVCFFLAGKLSLSYKKSNNVTIRIFSLFYGIFGIFFLFLGLPLFIPEYPDLVQASFVLAHLFLYFAMAVFLYFFFRIIGYKNIALQSALFIAFIGLAVFILSLDEGGDARQFAAHFGSLKMISWSHGGSLWIRLLVGIAGTVLGVSCAVYLLVFAKRNIKEENMVKKINRIGIGIGLLGVAAFFAFVLSALSVYNFLIVISAELITIAGLAFIYSAIGLEYN